MKVAVVGGGISGLTAVWVSELFLSVFSPARPPRRTVVDLICNRSLQLLNEYSDHEVDLFEANEYVGGHTNTVTFKGTPVDTGFIVFNKLTYPNFVKFLEILNVDYIASNMSFSVKRTFAPAYEWSGNGISSLFNGISSWTDRISQVRLIWDLVRFNYLAVDVLSGPEGDLTIQEYLSKHGYSDCFKRNYLLVSVKLFSLWC
jgi:predicted NAD/FAD-binding protein